MKNKVLIDATYSKGCSIEGIDVLVDGHKIENIVSVDQDVSKSIVNLSFVADIEFLSPLEEK